MSHSTLWNSGNTVSYIYRWNYSAVYVYWHIQCYVPRLATPTSDIGDTCVFIWYRSLSHDDVIKWKKNSALLDLCEGNSSVTGEFPSQRPVTQSFDVFFDMRLNKRLSKHSWGWWFETPLRPLWRHCKDSTRCVLVMALLEIQKDPYQYIWIIKRSQIWISWTNINRCKCKCVCVCICINV